MSKLSVSVQAEVVKIPKKQQQTIKRMIRMFTPFCRGRAGNNSPPSQVKKLPVKFQSEFHGSWVGLNIGDPPELATCLMNDVGGTIRIRREHT